jgi:hypothetical protein
MVSIAVALVAYVVFRRPRAAAAALPESSAAHSR